MATIPTVSLRHHFAGLIDPRGERSRRHELLDVIGLATKGGTKHTLASVPRWDGLWQPAGNTHLELFVDVVRQLERVLDAAPLQAAALKALRDHVLEITRTPAFLALEAELPALEAAVQDLFVFNRVRSRAELAAGIEAVTAEQVREAFQRMLASPPAVAIAGKVPAGTSDKVKGLLERP